MTNLRELRLDRGLTQQQVADAIKIGRTTYTQYETGSSRPDFITLVLIAHLFSVPISFLLEDSPFDMWDAINGERQTFLYYMRTSVEFNELFLGENYSLDNISLCEYVNFIDATVQGVRLTSEGDIEVALREWVSKAQLIMNSDKTQLEKNEYPIMTKYRRLNDSGKEYVDSQVDYALSQERYQLKEKRHPHIPDMKAIKEDAEAFVEQLKKQSVPTEK